MKRTIERSRNWTETQYRNAELLGLRGGPEAARARAQQELDAIRDRQLYVYRDILVHEVQHAIQHIEGFATGSSPSYFERNPIRSKEAAEALEEAIQNEYQIRKQLLQDHPELQADFDRYYQLNDTNYSDESAIDDESSVFREMEEIDQKFRDAGLGELWDQYYIARSELNAARNKAARPAIAPFTAYFNTAGEVESRNVQRRLNMTAEERQNSLLSETEDVAEESKIYLFEGGESLMAEPFTEDQKQKILAMAPGMAGARFAIDEKPYYQIPFADSVDAVINDTYTGNGSVFMRDTPKLFVEMGFSKLPIMTTAKHIKSIYFPKRTEKDHNHDLGELIKQIPEKLENPLMVITSKTHPDTSVVVILELTDKNGDAVVVPILLDGISQRGKIDAHIMTSAQGRSNAFTELVKNAIDKENNGTPSILYAQKNAESAANAEGVQFPNGFAFDSVNHNITDVGLKVKPQTETLQFKNWFKNSKVVDQDGKPLVVYHGTNWDILSEAPGEAVFDDKYRGAGSGDNGFYGRGFFCITKLYC